VEFDTGSPSLQVAAAKPKVEKKKKEVKKVVDDEGPLSDPLAEKLRQQRYHRLEMLHF
jgi:hypothetical protein